MSDGTHPQRPFEGNIMRFESANIARSRDATRHHDAVHRMIRSAALLNTFQKLH